MREGIESFFSDPANRKKVVTIAAIALVVLIAAAIIGVYKANDYPRELYIDTVAAPLAERVKKIQVEAPYYTKKIRSKTIEFYRMTDYKTKWLEFKGPHANYRAFIKAVDESAKYGLNPVDYDIKNIDENLEKLFDNRDRTPDDVARLDIRITSAFFLFTTHLIEGRIRQAGYGDFVWKKNPPKENDIKLLAENSSGNLYEIIDELHPPHEQYEKLRKALIEYRKLESSKDFAQPVALFKGTIKPGDKHAKVPHIRKRLQLTDLQDYDIEDSLRYDERMQDAVRQFQRRHGLTEDGIISAGTLAHLNQSLKQKADLIELNLERIRWLPREYGEDYISVNVPEYMLRVYENSKPKMEMRVVLGTEFNATPIFSDTLEYIVFSPTWTVPESIIKDEVIPDLQANAKAWDPERFMFYHKGEEVNPQDLDWEDEDLKPEDLKVVERPGQENSLGLVKFIMPNNLNIYLHDTPAERLFKKKKRTFSHGCIRLEKPVDFAKYLLRDNDKWDDEEKIKESMGKEDPVTVYLKKKYHVEIEYRTVWVDEDGLLHFRDDVYGHDKRQLSLLNRGGGV